MEVYSKHYLEPLDIKEIKSVSCGINSGDNIGLLTVTASNPEGKYSPMKRQDQYIKGHNKVKVYCNIGGGQDFTIFTGVITNMTMSVRNNTSDIVFTVKDMFHVAMKTKAIRITENSVGGEEYNWVLRLPRQKTSERANMLMDMIEDTRDFTPAVPDAFGRDPMLSEMESTDIASVGEELENLAVVTNSLTGADEEGFIYFRAKDWSQPDNYFPEMTMTVGQTLENIVGGISYRIISGLTRVWDKVNNVMLREGLDYSIDYETSTLTALVNMPSVAIRFFYVAYVFQGGVNLVDISYSIDMENTFARFIAYTDSLDEEGQGSSALTVAESNSPEAFSKDIKLLTTNATKTTELQSEAESEVDSLNDGRFSVQVNVVAAPFIEKGDAIRIIDRFNTGVDVIAIVDGIQFSGTQNRFISALTCRVYDMFPL